MDFVKNLEASSCAAALLGPKHSTFADCNKSATPATSGASGPIITKSMTLCFTKCNTASPSIMLSGTHSAISTIPAFPGATNKFSHFGFCLMAQAKECSRPPPPKIKIFKNDTPIGLFLTSF